MCLLIQRIASGDREFQVCADLKGGLHVVAACAGGACPTPLADALFDRQSGGYTLIERDVIDESSGLRLGRVVREKCLDRATAIERLAAMVC